MNQYSEFDVLSPQNIEREVVHAKEKCFSLQQIKEISRSLESHPSRILPHVATQADVDADNQVRAECGLEPSTVKVGDLVYRATDLVAPIQRINREAGR